MFNDRWNRRFLELARQISQWSKDPSTKVGAVIVRPDKTIASVGYNGFPRGIEDSAFRLSDRALKYQLVIHAEMNAILNAKEPLRGYTIYVWPPSFHSPSCNRCAAHIIQAGIRAVVGFVADKDNPLALRWEEVNIISKGMLGEAKVIVRMMEQPEVIDLEEMRKNKGR